MTQSHFQIKLKFEIQKSYFSKHPRTLTCDTSSQLKLLALLQFSLQLFCSENTYSHICIKQEKVIAGKISKFFVAISPKNFTLFLN